MEQTLNLNLTVSETELLLKGLNALTSALANKIKIQAESQLTQKPKVEEEKAVQG